jgi:hypothetical protein
MLVRSRAKCFSACWHVAAAVQLLCLSQRNVSNQYTHAMMHVMSKQNEVAGVGGLGLLTLWTLSETLRPSFWLNMGFSRVCAFSTNAPY